MKRLKKQLHGSLKKEKERRKLRIVYVIGYFQATLLGRADSNYPLGRWHNDCGR